MTILNSQFDVISRDPHKNAQAGLMVVLHVEGAPTPYSSLPAGGTPVAGNIPAGAIVMMNANGNAVLADPAAVGYPISKPVLHYITVDGDQDYDGAFVHTITCIQGGGEFLLDTGNFVAGAYTPGDLLTPAGGANAGKFTAATAGPAPGPGTEHIYGVVGSQGYDSVKDTLHIIIPQGMSPIW